MSTRARGSSTCCILCLENERLHASNLGDSGALLSERERRGGWGLGAGPSCGGQGSRGCGIDF